MYTYTSSPPCCIEKRRPAQKDQNEKNGAASPYSIVALVKALVMALVVMAMVLMVLVLMLAVMVLVKALALTLAVEVLALAEVVGIGRGC